MLRSMTGFGREQAVISGHDITVEIRSVNHRFYEFSARVPRAYGFLEEKLKTLLQGAIKRGKVEVNVIIRTTESTQTQVEINRAVADGYVNALRSVQDELTLKDDLSLSNLLRIPEVFTVEKVVEDENIIWDLVKEAAQSAIERFVEMREVEGKRLHSDIMEARERIRANVEVIEAAYPKIVSDYRDRLTLKMKEILSDNHIEEQRIVMEAAIFADRIAVDEEVVRLKSHLDQLSSILNENDAIGRKLDFLVQEINREINTIGSKVQDVEVTRIVVDLKSELEKIREQLQNIE